MSIFGSIFERRSTGTLTEYDDFWYNLTGSSSSSGESVNSKTAMRYWAYYACISLIAQTIGCFPLSLKRKVGEYSEDATDEELYWIMRKKPNPGWTSMYWREFGQTMQFNQGNDYAWIERNRLGIKAIWPLDPWAVSPKEARGGEIINGRLLRPKERYYTAPALDGTTVYLLQKDILHVPGFGFDGLQGYSFPQTYGLDVIGRGISQNKFANRWFKNGVFTSGVFEHPGSLGKNADKWRAAVDQRFAGAKNTGTPMTLENGMKWNPAKLSLIDQQFIEQEKEVALQVCGMLHVPPHKISIPTSQQAKNNTEEMNRHFLDTTILPHVRKREDIYDTQLLTDKQMRAGLFFKFDFDHFLRPDGKTRAEIAEIRQRMGVPVNRYLANEDEPRTKHGDVEFISQNLATAEFKIREGGGEPGSSKENYQESENVGEEEGDQES